MPELTIPINWKILREEWAACCGWEHIGQLGQVADVWQKPNGGLGMPLSEFRDLTKIMNSLPENWNVDIFLWREEGTVAVTVYGKQSSCQREVKITADKAESTANAILQAAIVVYGRETKTE